MKNKFLMACIIILVMVAISCVSTSNKRDYAILDKVINNNGAIVVDVREVDEYAEGHIEGSLNIPLGMIQDSLSVYDEYEHVVLVCRSGGRSGKAINILDSLGVKNISNGGGWDSYNAKLNERKRDVEK